MGIPATLLKTAQISYESITGHKIRRDSIDKPKDWPVNPFDRKAEKAEDKETFFSAFKKGALGLGNVASAILNKIIVDERDQQTLHYLRKKGILDELYK